MKKFITRSLFAFVVMGFSLTAVNAAPTEFTYEGWQAPDGYGTIVGETDSIITNLQGEETANGGMYYGPFNKQSTQALENGIKEETHIDLDFEFTEVGEFFEVSLAMNDENDAYLDEAVVMTQLVEEGKFKLTAGWAPDFEAVVTDDGVYTYQWEAYIENEKAYVKFNLLKNGVVVDTTGAIEFTKLNAEGVTVRYLWFCNINLDGGVYVYTRLPELTIDTDTESEVLTVVDEDETEGIIESALFKNKYFNYYVKRYDTFVKIAYYEFTEDDLETVPEESMALFEDAIEDDKIVNYYSAMVGVSDGVDTDILYDYNDEIEYTLVLPENIPAVAKGYERKYNIIEMYLEESEGQLKEVSRVLDVELSKDGKTLTYSTNYSGVYALSYVDSLLPPQTGDNIITYVIIGIVSMFGLAVISLKAKKLFN